MGTASGLRKSAGLQQAPVRFAVLGGLAVAVDLAVDPVHTHVPLCPLHALTGWWCPLCGSLRAVDQLGHGRIGAAIHDNIVLVALIPVLLVYWLDWVARSRRGEPRRTISRRLTITGVAVLVAFGVLRNLPAMEFLRP